MGHPKMRWLVLCTAITTLTWLLAGCAGNPEVSAASTTFAPFILVVWLFVLSTVGLLTGCGSNEGSNFTPNPFTGTSSSTTSGTTGSTNGTTTSPTQVPVKLAFVKPPVTPGTLPTALQTIPDFQVAIEDANGNVVSSDNAPITITITSGPSGAKISGTTTVNAVNGVATFSGLSLNLAGAYTIQATSSGLQPASVSFSLLPLPLAFKGHRDLAVVTGRGSSVVVADFDGDKIPDVAVSSGIIDIAGNYYNNPNVSVFFGNADGSFTAPISVNTGFASSFGAGAMAVSNLKGDSVQDIFVGAVSYSSSTSSAAILIPGSNPRSAAGWTVQPQSLSVSGENIVAVSAGNFEGDGVSKDFVVATGYTSFSASKTSFTGDHFNVVLLHGDGSSTTLSPHVIVSSGSGTATGLAVGDFNGDGALDFAVARPYFTSSSSTSNYVSIWFNQGTGKLSGGAATFYSRSFNTGRLKPTAIASGDFNGDGITDLAVAGLYTPNSNTYIYPGVVSTMLGVSHSASDSSTPILQQGATQTVVGPIHSIATVSFTANGPLGVVGSCEYADQLFTFIGDGTGNLSGPRYYANGDTDDNSDLRAGSVFAVADLNGDGLPDVVAENDAGGRGRNVNLLLNNGDNTLLDATIVRAAAPRRIHQNQYPVEEPVTSTIADVNGDGRGDLIWTQYSYTTQTTDVWVALSNGAGTFGTPTRFATGVAGFHSAQLFVGDFNGDHNLDVAMGLQYSTKASFVVLPGNADGTFDTSHVKTTALNNAQNINAFAVADLNGDGNLDIAFTTSANTYVALGNGDGTFGAPSNVAGVASDVIAIADFNKDGTPDLVVAHNLNTVVVLLGNVSNQLWSAPNGPESQSVSTVGRIDSLTTGDFDGDGKTDLVISAEQNSRSNYAYLLPTATFLKGNGDGTFAPGQSAFVDTLPLQTVAVDINADGILDVVVGNNDSNNVSVLLGNGDGTFLPQQVWGLAGAENNGSKSVGDTSGTGKIDIFAVDSESGAISILLHE